MATLDTVKVVNTTTIPRDGWMTANLLFAAAAYTPTETNPVVEASNGQTFDKAKPAYGIGRDITYWPDGSARSMAVDVPVGMNSAATRTVTITDSTAKPTFAWHPNIIFNTTRTPLEQAIRPDGDWLVEPDPDTGANYVFEIDTGVSKLLKVRWRSRDNRMWCIVWMQVFSGYLTGKFVVRGGFSDQTTTDLTYKPPLAITIVASGPYISPRHLGSRIVSGPRFFRRAPNLPIETRIDVVAKDYTLDDGQGFYVKGSMHWWDGGRGNVYDYYSALAEFFSPNSSPLLSMSTSVASYLNPIGYIVPGYSNATAKSEAATLYAGGESDPWDVPALGMNKKPGNTGTQPDFGAVNEWVWKAASAQAPEMLYPLERSCMHEVACRPVQHRDQNCDYVTLANHPNPTIWEDRADTRFSIDKLGKTANPNPFISPATKVSDWYGYDRQHYSINCLTGTALITGEFDLIEACKERAELWKAAFRTDSPSGTVNAPGTGRAIGRSMQAACNLYWATGDDDLLYKIKFWVENALKPHWDSGIPFSPGGEWVPANDGRLRIRPYAATISIISAGEQWYSGWEKAQCIMGLKFAHKLLTDYHSGPNASQFTTALATLGTDCLPAYCDNDINDAWKDTGGGVYTNAFALEFGDPSNYQGGIDERWSLPACQIAKTFAGAPEQVLAATIEADVRTRADTEWWTVQALP